MIFAHGEVKEKFQVRPAPENCAAGSLKFRPVQFGLYPFGWHDCSECNLSAGLEQEALDRSVDDMNPSSRCAGGNLGNASDVSQVGGANVFSVALGYCHARRLGQRSVT